MTLQELIDQLTELQSELGPNEDPEVRLAIQPQWAFEHSIDQVVLPDQPRVITRDEFEGMSEEGTPRCVYIGEGRQVGYLPGEASRALGWR